MCVCAHAFFWTCLELLGLRVWVVRVRGLFLGSGDLGVGARVAKRGVGVGLDVLRGRILGIKEAEIPKRPDAAKTSPASSPSAREGS